MFANPHYHHYHQRDRSMAMYAGLLTTIYKRSCVSAGMPLSYLQFNDEVALSLVCHEESEVLCTLFHEPSDGADFGRLIASQILFSFLEDFEKSQKNKASFSDHSFLTFGGKLIEAIDRSVVQIMARFVRKVRGVHGALAYWKDDRHVEAGTLEDKIGLMSCIPELIASSSELIAENDDTTRVITLVLSKRLVFIHRLDDVTLLILSRKSFDRETYQSSIEEVENFIGKVNSILSTLLD